MKDLNYLNRIWKRGTDFLGVKYSILCGAMSWVSESSLVAAVSNSGGFGIIAAANMPGEILAAEIDKTFKKTRNNFGVNIITVTPYLKDQLDAALQKKSYTHFFWRRYPKRKRHTKS